MNINNQYSAANLYAGGWRADEKEDIIEEYGLTEEEAKEICDELERIEVSRS